MDGENEVDDDFNTDPLPYTSVSLIECTLLQIIHKIHKYM